MYQVLGTRYQVPGARAGVRQLLDCTLAKYQAPGGYFKRLKLRFLKIAMNLNGTLRPKAAHTTL